MGDPGAERSSHNRPTKSNLHYVCYGTEKESPYLPAIKSLISKDLSEPYSIYVYRYFLYQWGDLCFMVRSRQSLTYHNIPLTTQQGIKQR